MSARIRLQAYLEDERLKKVHNRVKSAFDSRDFVAHSWDHIYRDTINAISLKSGLTLVMHHFTQKPAKRSLLIEAELKSAGIFLPASWLSLKNMKDRDFCHD